MNMQMMMPLVAALQLRDKPGGEPIARSMMMSAFLPDGMRGMAPILMMQSVTGTIDETEQAKASQIAMQDQLTSSQAQVARTQDQLTAKQAQLTTTQDQLTTTQAKLASAQVLVARAVEFAKAEKSDSLTKSFAATFIADAAKLAVSPPDVIKVS